jgi:hypothetical protein
MGEPTTPKAPQLPPEAPEDLRDFLECKSAKVTLKDGNLSWLPLPPEIKDFVPEGAKPDLAIEPGATPGTASIKVSLGPISLSLPASVSGGQLTVDTSDPGMFTPQKLVDGINQAVKDINDWFKHNGKGFGKPVFGNKEVTLTKVDLAAPPAKATTTPTPVTPTPPKPPPPPAPPPAAAPAVPGGCLGILFLVLAVVAVGAVLFLGGPALGLFGAAIPTASPTTTGVPSPSATPTATASPTPDFRTVRSDDGRAFLFIPLDSAPADAPIALTARTQADAPPELEGITFRSAFYRITPMDQAFTGEVGFGRLIDVGEQGLDPDEVGYSVTSLALRTYDGTWSWLGGQGSLIGGTAGTSPETQVQQKGSLMHVGEVFGVGGTVWAHRDPYPEEVEFAIGTTVRFGVKLTGPNGGAFVPSQGASILRAAKYTSLPGIVQVTEPVLSVGSDGFPRMDVTATCSQVGDLVVGSDLVFSQTGTSSLLERLELGTPPEHEMSFRTSMRCVAATAGSQPALEAGCVSVIHQPLSSLYPSYLHWLFGFGAGSTFPPGAMLDLSYREGSSGPFQSVTGIPIVDRRATADTGITMYGEKIWSEAHVSASDGSTTDIIESFRSVFGSSVTVTSAEGTLGGNACQ